MKSMLQNVATWAGEIAACILTIAGVLKVWPGIVAKAKAGLRKASPLTSIFGALQQIAERLDAIERGNLHLIQRGWAVMEEDEVKAWFTTDARGQFEFANRLLRTWMGLEADEIHGNGWQSGVDENERHRIMLAWDDSIERERRFEEFCILSDRNGKKTKVRIMAVPMRDNHGEVMGFQGHAIIAK